MKKRVITSGIYQDETSRGRDGNRVEFRIQQQREGQSVREQV